MKEQFISKLLASNWQMGTTRSHARSLLAAIVAAVRSERPDEDICGDPLPKMRLVGDTAVIPITGTLCVSLPDWVKEYGLGLTDANDVVEELSQAAFNPAVSHIMLDFDSPGGQSIAGHKLYDAVEAARRYKPVDGYCPDGCLICSAAYNAAAPCRLLLVGKYSTVGCIGSYQALLDDTKFWELMGITIEVFRSGEYKGIGIDSLTENQRAFLQETVDEFGARFRANVSKYRPGLASDDMQGQWYMGETALKKGFASDVAPDLQSAIARARATP